MELSTKKRLAAAVLAISTIAAFVAPFLLHSPPIQGNTSPGTNDNNNNNGGSTTSPPGGGTGNQGGQGSGPRKKNLNDLLSAMANCETDNPGTQRSLEAKVQSAIRAGNSTRTDHHLQVLEHQLNTPAVEKHAGECASDLKSLVDELLTA